MEQGEEIMTHRSPMRPRAYLGAALAFLALGLVAGLGISGAWNWNASGRAETAAAPAATVPGLPLKDDLESPFVTVVERALPAVVHISTLQQSPGGQGSAELYEGPFGDMLDRMFPDRRRAPELRRSRPSSGSGFLFDPDGRILTNNHVVDNATDITVTLVDKRTFKAKVVGQDPATDVAVIQIKAPNNVPVLPLGDSDRIRVGDWAIAIGTPLGELEGTVTAGIISAKGRSALNIVGGGPDYQDFIQTDASINFGNSGGPLMNIRGEVIGINTAINPSGQGIGFAIPINLAKRVAEQLVAHGKVVRGYMGVLPGELTPDLAASFGIDQNSGILIEQVVDDSPAARAGFRRGDIVTKFDGHPVHNVTDFRLRVADTPVDDRVPVEVLRDGKKHTLHVTLADREVQLASQSGPSGPSGEDSEDVAQLGLGVRQMTREDRADYGGEEGVLVADVELGSDAAQKGIDPGDLVLEVNGRRIRSTEDFERAMSEAKGSGRPVRLLVGELQRNGQLTTRFVALRFEGDESR
jgi:serine protease Do